MATVKKSFATPSTKPVDVEYRLRRALQSVEEARVFLNAVDPSVLPEGLHDDIGIALAAVETRISEAQTSAPKKKARAVKPAEEK